MPGSPGIQSQTVHAFLPIDRHRLLLAARHALHAGAHRGDVDAPAPYIRTFMPSLSASSAKP
jgi:hypothetical protein